MGKDGPLDMQMYNYMFNTTRIPQTKTDTWAVYKDQGIYLMHNCFTLRF